MKKYLYSLLALCLFGCTDNELPAGARAGGFKLADANQQNEVLAVMNDADIPFIIDKRGFVVYLLRDQSAVHGILRTVQHGENLDPTYWESAVLVDQLTRDKYEAAFRDAEIPYDITENEGVIQINWSQTYGPQVDVIRQKLDEEIMSSILKKGTNNAPQPTQ